MDEAHYQTMIKEMGKDIKDLKHNHILLVREVKELRTVVNDVLIPFMNETRSYE